MENRITTNMGKADLVIEPRDTEGKFWASVQWAGEHDEDGESQYSGVFCVSEDQAKDLIAAAKDLIFGNRRDAYLWLNRSYSAMSHYRPARKLAA